jgi:multidrug efflux pump subunit AcrA (membrane-fusion protein)
MNSLQSTMFQANQAFINDKGINNPSDQQKADPKYIEENADWLKAEADYKNQTTVVTQTQAALNSATLGYQATQDITVTAPIAGTVENLANSVGDRVAAAPSATTAAASATLGSSSPVLYIVTDDSSNASLAVVQINEVDFPKVKLGQSATITLPALPNKTFKGHVAKIDQIGTNTSSVISFNVYIGIDNSDSNIAPNMTVNVDINTAKNENTLTVPNAAIKPYKGGKAVEILDKSKPATKQIKLVPVTIGIKGIDRTEIISGVKEGTVVITGTTKPVVATLGG